MGTRSITVVKDEDDKKIIEMYKQYDGYPNGFGEDLIDFISSGKIVNGISIKETQKVFNGISCFAAQLVAEFKDGAGGIYLHAPVSDYKDKKKYWKTYGAEYYYEIDSDMNIRCWDTYSGQEIPLVDGKFKEEEE